MSKGRTVVTLIALGCFLSVFDAFAMSCETILESSPVELVQFMDYAKLENMDISALRARHQFLSRALQPKLRILPSQKARLRQAEKLLSDFFKRPHQGRTGQQLAQDQLAYEKEIGLDEAERNYDQNKTEIELLRHHIEALARVIQRRSQGVENPFSVPLPVEARISVRGKTEQQVANKIRAAIVAAGINPKNAVLRYFNSSREDVVRVHGTDRTGSEKNYVRSDVWDLAQALRERGLGPDDGFYALPLSYMIKSITGEPFSMIRDFVAGTKSLAVFDASKLVDPKTDYYFFKDPDHKIEALLGIITPAP